MLLVVELEFGDDDIDLQEEMMRTEVTLVFIVLVSGNILTACYSKSEMVSIDTADSETYSSDTPILGTESPTDTVSDTESTTSNDAIVDSASDPPIVDTVQTIGTETNSLMDTQTAVTQDTELTVTIIDDTMDTVDTSLMDTADTSSMNTAGSDSAEPNESTLDTEIAVEEGCEVDTRLVGSWSRIEIDQDGRRWEARETYNSNGTAVEHFKTLDTDSDEFEESDLDFFWCMDGDVLRYTLFNLDLNNDGVYEEHWIRETRCVFENDRLHLWVLPRIYGSGISGKWHQDSYFERYNLHFDGEVEIGTIQKDLYINEVLNDADSGEPLYNYAYSESIYNATRSTITSIVNQFGQVIWNGNHATFYVSGEPVNVGCLHSELDFVEWFDSLDVDCDMLGYQKE